MDTLFQGMHPAQLAYLAQMMDQMTTHAIRPYLASGSSPADPIANVHGGGGGGFPMPTFSEHRAGGRTSTTRGDELGKAAPSRPANIHQASGNPHVEWTHGKVPQNTYTGKVVSQFGKVK